MLFDGDIETMRILLGIVLAALSVSLRRLSGLCYPKGHDLRKFNIEMSDLLRGVDREYLEHRV